MHGVQDSQEMKCRKEGVYVLYGMECDKCGDKCIGETVSNAYNKGNDHTDEPRKKIIQLSSL